MAPNSSDVTAGINATIAHYNNLRKDVLLGTKTVGSETDGATITFDLSSTTKTNLRTVTLGGNRTLALSNPTVGQVFIIRLVQDGTGGRTVTWWSTIKWPGGSAPTLSTGANRVDVFGFICTSTGNYDGFFLGFDLS